MFSNISWKDYTVFTLVILFIYYTIVLVIFYNNTILQFLTDKFLNKAKGGRENDVLRDGVDELYNENKEQSINSLGRLQIEIRSQLEKAKLKKTVPEEIVMSLQLTLQNYQSLKYSESKQAIDNFIKEECENVCSIHFSDVVINQMWTR